MRGAFPPGFFDRLDPTPDPAFYAQPRLVTHVDHGAIAAVGELYEELGLKGRNQDPRLPFPDASFETAVCCVSVDYLTRPLEVFTEVARILRLGAPFGLT